MRDAQVDAEAAAWNELRSTSSAERAYSAWLELQCGMIPGVLGGLLLRGPAERGPFAPVARWPPGLSDVKPLTTAAERVLGERRGLVLQSGSEERVRFQVAQPIELDGQLLGAAVVEVSPCPQAELAHALRTLAWGAAWLEVFERRALDSGAGAHMQRLETLPRLVAAVAERGRFRAAATHFATAIATELSCDRASVGFMRRDRVRFAALSHSAHFGSRTNLVRAIEAAMDEAAEQQCSVVYPEATGDEARVVRAHKELAQEFGSGATCSVLLVHKGEISGVLTLERSGDQPFEDDEVDMAEAVAALIGPMLELQRLEERWLAAKALESLRTQLHRLIGPEHVAIKLTALALLAVVCFLTFATGEYRVTARSVLEPQIQRAATAPFDGYLAEAPLRAGDLVEEGDLLARLDDRDLRLERLGELSRVQQLTKQTRQALAGRDAGEVRVLSARVEQARAKLDLIDDRLSRTSVSAPFDGVIVSGDLSQHLGAPLQRGDVLFEIAPLDAYRVILEVDEGDIREVDVGQRGSLVMAANPETPIPFEVVSVTPVSEASEGKNFFRVEARFDDTPERLRPGMRGVGKIDVDRRRLIWIWSHAAIDKLRLALWRWLP